MVEIGQIRKWQQIMSFNSSDFFIVLEFANNRQSDHIDRVAVVRDLLGKHTIRSYYVSTIMRSSVIA